MKFGFLLLLAAFFGCFLFGPLCVLLSNAFFIQDGSGQRHFTLSFFALLAENRLYRTALIIGAGSGVSA